jgi:hypothetical protein
MTMPPKPAPSSRSHTKSQHSSKSPQLHAHKRKAVKQPSPPSERLKRLFTSLCAQIDGAHFVNAVKTCDKSTYRQLVYKLLLSPFRHQYCASSQMIKMLCRQNCLSYYRQSNMMQPCLLSALALNMSLSGRIRSIEYSVNKKLWMV